MRIRIRKEHPNKTKTKKGDLNEEKMYDDFILLVSGCSQGQDYGVSYLQHGLQDGSNNNEEDDGEKEGSVDDLKLNEASLDSKDQQGDALCHSPAQTGNKH